VTPPVAKQVPHTTTVHGETLSDPYRWLHDKSNPEVIAHLEAENAYAASVMAPAEALQRRLYDEMVARLQETDETPPGREGDCFYYTRTEQGKQYAIYCRRRGSLEAPEEILLDGNREAEGHAYFRVGVFEHSPDHSLLAWSVDYEGDEVYEIRVKDLRTGETYADRIPGSYYSLAWASDNRAFYYVTVDEAKRPYKVFHHRLGEPADELIHHEPDERFNVRVERTRSGAFIWIAIESQTTTEYRYLDASRVDEAPRMLFPRRQDVEYEVEHHGESFYVRISDHGKNFRLARTPAAAPSLEDAVELIPHRRDVALESIDAFRHHMVTVERVEGLRRIGIEDLRTGERHDVAFDEPAYAVSLTQNPEFEAAELRFTYSSLATPVSIFDYHMEARTRVLRKQFAVLGGYDPSRYRVERLQAAAPDGARVPISLVYREGTPLDGTSPLLLYGYGAYGIPTDPAFSPDRLSLLDRGFVYAVAHIRGSSDLGRYWYEDGKLLRKRNTFTDFVACAEHLVRERYTSPGRLAINGGSAGGLLMGAVMNLRPDLFHAVFTRVPFVDVVNTMLDPTLPLTVPEYEEWGNPQELEYFRYIRSYAPYENVEAKRYPHLLITAGLNDPRVSYWEPAKWAARLRERKTDGNLLLLKTNMGAGHFGSSGRYERLREVAFDYAFLLLAMGLNCAEGESLPGA
jgi:oligopeptidase B